MPRKRNWPLSLVLRTCEDGCEPAGPVNVTLTSASALPSSEVTLPLRLVVAWASPSPAISRMKTGRSSRRVRIGRPYRIRRTACHPAAADAWSGREPQARLRHDDPQRLAGPAPAPRERRRVVEPLGGHEQRDRRHGHEMAGA